MNKLYFALLFVIFLGFEQTTRANDHIDNLNEAVVGLCLLATIGSGCATKFSYDLFTASTFFKRPFSKIVSGTGLIGFGTTTLMLLYGTIAILSDFFVDTLETSKKGKEAESFDEFDGY